MAGADISEFNGLTAGEGMDLAKRGQEIFFKIENATKPIVAAVTVRATDATIKRPICCLDIEF